MSCHFEWEFSFPTQHPWDSSLVAELLKRDFCRNLWSSVAEPGGSVWALGGVCCSHPLLSLGAADGRWFSLQFILLDFFFLPSLTKMFPKVSNFTSAVEVTADIFGVFCGEMHTFHICFSLKMIWRYMLKLSWNFLTPGRKASAWGKNIWDCQVVWNIRVEGFSTEAVFSSLN